MKKNILSAVVLSFVLLFIGCPLLATKSSTNVYTRETITNPDNALDLLKQGNTRFFNNENLAQDLSLAKREALKSGQTPFAVIVSCSDSRSVSTHSFNQGLGDLFEIKTAGNVIDQDALGSIEYGVTKLNTPLVVVLAHENCGAVHATIEINEGNMQLPKESAINSIVTKITPSYNVVKNRDAVPREQMLRLVSIENANNMKNEILKNSAIKAKVDSGAVQVVTAKYSLDGSILWQ